MKGRPPAGRLVALLVVMVLGLGGVSARLVLLQVHDAEAYEALARDQRVRTVKLPARRGSIYDRTMAELAISLPARAVYANPALVKDPAGTAESLSPLLRMQAGQIRRGLESSEPFVYLARQVPVKRAERLAKLDLPGIGLLEESRRYYPGEELAAQILGFVNVDDVGLAGLELQHDDVLSGEPGELVIEQDPLGRPIPQGERRVVNPRPGSDLVLTIDRDLQFQTQRALEGAVRANEAKGGMVIIMRPRTGEILTMATAPGFDANRYGDVPPERTKNRSVTDMYEPGSVNKVITAAAALEEGTVGLRQSFTVPDRLKVGDKVFRDAHPHPTMAMTITDIIAESSNTGTIQIAQGLGAERVDSYLRAFGFADPTGVGFPGEAAGLLKPANEWWGTSMGTIPIGQGIAVTPLQMASVYATIANGGVRVRPTLVRGTVDADGNFSKAPSAARERVVSKRTASKVSGMLALAVMTGTGGQAQIRHYWVAGKTGTARKPLDGQLGYSDKYVASFIGFLPASRPELVVAAILDEPTTVYGGVAAAPLFREVSRYAVAHLGIAPSEPPRTPPALVET